MPGKDAEEEAEDEDDDGDDDIEAIVFDQFTGRFHDRLDLLHVIDVQGGDSVVVFGGMIENDSHWY